MYQNLAGPGDYDHDHAQLIGRRTTLSFARNAPSFSIVDRNKMEPFISKDHGQVR
jgi:hypothetical protein